MTLSRASYDSAEGIEVFLNDGLRGLSCLQQARQESYKRDKVFLSTWVVAGKFQLDGCGNLAELTELTSDKPLPTVWEQTPDSCAVWQVSYTARMAWWADHDWTCTICGKGWTLETAFDVHVDRSNYHGDRKDLRFQHKGCAHRAGAAAEEERFARLMHEAGFTWTEVVALPNGYHPNPPPNDPFYLPWYRFATQFGTIVIGWRKRVINVDWSATGRSFDVDAVTKDQVTTGNTYMHAYGYEKAGEYLKTLRRLLLPQGYRPSQSEVEEFV